MILLKITTFIIALYLNAVSFASIRVYDSSGQEKVLNIESKNFINEVSPPLHVLSKNDTLNKQRNISDSVKEYLLSHVENFKICYQDKSCNESRTLVLDSFNEISQSVIVLKYHQEFKINSILKEINHDIPLVSQNIIVRLKNGKIEAIGISKYDSIDKNKTLFFKIKERLKLHWESFKKIHVDLNKLIINHLLDSEDSKIKYEFILNSLFKLKNEFNQKWKSSLIDEFEKSLHLIQNNTNTINTNTINTAIHHLMKDLKINDDDLKDWMSKINLPLLLFEKHIQSQTLKLYVSHSGDIHLQFRLSNASMLSYEFIFGKNKIDFRKVPLELGLDQFTFVEVSKVISPITYENPIGTHIVEVTPKSEITQLTFENLNTPFEILSYYFTRYYHFYKNQFNFERTEINNNNEVVKSSEIKVFYGIKQTPSRSDNASWVSAPYSKFMIGNGSIKFRDLYKNASIIGHEYFHYVEEQLTQLISENESGALKEHGADLMGLISSETILDKVTPPKFAVGCGILTDNALSTYQYKNLMTLESSICLRNFNEPHLSYSEQATNIKSINDKYGDNYQEKCISSSSNDYCGIHFQTGIPNQVLSYFMMDLKEKSNGSLTWNEVRKLTSNIIFNTYSYRLQKDAGFKVYFQQLTNECFDVLSNLNYNSACESIIRKYNELL